MSAPSAPPSAVLDTSVLYPAWSRVLLLRLARRQPVDFRGIWSREIARELWRTFEVRDGRRGIAPEQVRHGATAALYPLRQAFAMVAAESRPSGTPASPLPDPNDAHLWNAALSAGAVYIVSHNTRHFPPPSPQMAAGEHVLRHHIHGVEFVTAIEFIEDILGLDAATLYGAPIPLGGLIRSGRSRQ